MAKLSLTSEDREFLETVIATSSEIRQLKRARALLSVATGDAISCVARRLGVDRNSIANWIGRFADISKPPADRFYDRPIPGRPNELFHDAVGGLRELLNRHPSELGINDEYWTASLLKVQLEIRGMVISETCIMRAMKYLGFQWQRIENGSRRWVHDPTNSRMDRAA